MILARIFTKIYSMKNLLKCGNFIWQVVQQHLDIEI